MITDRKYAVNIESKIRSDSIWAKHIPDNANVIMTDYFETLEDAEIHAYQKAVDTPSLVRIEILEEGAVVKTVFDGNVIQ